MTTLIATALVLLSLFIAVTLWMRAVVNRAHKTVLSLTKAVEALPTKKDSPRLYIDTAGKLEADMGGQYLRAYLTPVTQRHRLFMEVE